MEQSKKIKELRESTGMNRKEFCDYFQIPYRTVTEWERDNRHAPEYVVRLLEYYIRMEKMIREKTDEERREDKGYDIAIVLDEQEGKMRTWHYNK